MQSPLVVTRRSEAPERSLGRVALTLHLTLRIPFAIHEGRDSRVEQAVVRTLGISGCN